jgi:lipopolysaccharide biosynthesis regulator YciM
MTVAAKKNRATIKAARALLEQTDIQNAVVDLLRGRLVVLRQDPTLHDLRAVLAYDAIEQVKASAPRLAKARKSKTLLTDSQLWAMIRRRRTDEDGNPKSARKIAEELRGHGYTVRHERVSKLLKSLGPDT